MIAARYERGWEGLRACAFISVRVLELLVNLIVYPIFGHVAVALMAGLIALEDLWRPLPALDPALDLRDYYLVAP